MVRKANLKDVQPIFEIVESFSKKGIMLNRPVAEIYDNLRDFFVYEEDGSVAGLSALHVCGPDLGEIRSLAVRGDFTKKGIGKALVRACLEDARALGVKRVFALTYKVSFFEKLGFQIVDKMVLPQKIWGDCLKCAKFPGCDETAVIIELNEQA